VTNRNEQTAAVDWQSL